MKRVLKSNLQFDNGYILDGDEIIALPSGVRGQLMALEELVEHAAHEKKLNGKPEIEDVKPFKPSSIDVEARIKVNTPLLDKKEAEGRALMQEVKLQSLEKKINRELADIQLLINWADDDYVIIDERCLPFGEVKMCLPMIGDPLKLTVEDIVSWVVASLDTEGLLMEDPEEVVDLRVQKTKED